jgi:hypothetical protein
VLSGNPPFTLVHDYWEVFPSFGRTLYGALDWDLVHIQILWFFFFDTVTEGQSMVAIFLAYVIERLLRSLRGSLGESNLTKKTMV